MSPHKRSSHPSVSVIVVVDAVPVVVVDVVDVVPVELELAVVVVADATPVVSEDPPGQPETTRPTPSSHRRGCFDTPMLRGYTARGLREHPG
jgi:hypothetical protein